MAEKKIYEHSDAERRIMRAMGRMPGGGPIEEAAAKLGWSGRHEPKAMSLEEVADYLEAVQKFFAASVAKATQDSRDLGALRADLEAVRRVFGIREPAP
jgi:hypothetical protein